MVVNLQGISEFNHNPCVAHSLNNLNELPWDSSNFGLWNKMANVLEITIIGK